MSTSASRNENRLTAEDRERMVQGINATMNGWPRGFIPRPGSDTIVLERVAAHSIGCSSLDLRDSELDEISTMVAEAIKGRY